MYDWELKMKLAKLFGLNTDKLMSFSVTVNPDEPVLVEAIYYTGNVVHEELEMLTKEFVVLPLNKEETADGK